MGVDTVATVTCNPQSKGDGWF